MFTVEDIVEICSHFDVDCRDIGECIDTSKFDADQRYNYKINDAFFLKITSNKSINEKYLNDINRLISNYKSIGVYCPSLQETNKSKLSHEVVKGKYRFTCYLEEKSEYPLSEPQQEVDYEFKKQVLQHLGFLANKFTNINLSDIRSMWSLIELAPLDDEIDEKQENFNNLMNCLKENNHTELMSRLLVLNDVCRKRIEGYMPKLPRCVYQGDLNNSNILVDDIGNFKGLIDFNLSGTEVNINCFLNESMYFFKEKDFVDLSAKELYLKMTDIQKQLLHVVTKNYKLNIDELEVMSDYNKVIYTSFWPNTTLMIRLIDEKKHSHKVIDLLQLIYDS